MPHVSITRRYRFCAAHRLHTDHLTPEANRAVFGKCNNPNGHGHNYVVLVTVKNSGSQETHDLERLDRVVKETIVRRFDHQDLNRDPEFAELTTTGENLVKLIWDLLVSRVPVGSLEKVGVVETRDNYFEYAGSAQVTGGLRG
jgi:6-pyruvoyltetrahydropterin/6-carboxytetrahydropterin synthase